MAKLKIGNGKVVLLTDKDLKKVQDRKWRYVDGKVQGHRTDEKTGKRRRIFMRDFILNYPKGTVTQKNGNALDLRRANLEVTKVSVAKKAPAKPKAKTTAKKTTTKK